MVPGFKARKIFTQKALNNLRAHKAKVQDASDLRSTLLESVRRGASIAVTKAYKLEEKDLKSEERPQKMTLEHQINH